MIPIRPAVRTVCAAAAIGAGYGVTLRAWMRLVSTSPEFSWGGTAYIVAAFTVLGTTAGLVTAARTQQQDHRRRQRRLLVVRSCGIALSLGCFVAAGAAMLPTIVPAALGRARTDWRRSVRVILVAFGAGSAIVLSLASTLAGLRTDRLALALVLYLALCAVEVEMTARLYAPSLPPGTLRHRALDLHEGGNTVSGRPSRRGTA